jgi:hypothetical protein
VLGMLQIFMRTHRPLPKSTGTMLVKGMQCKRARYARG